DGWKRRHGVARYRIVGEAGSADFEEITKSREEFQKMLAEWDPEVFLNSDETAVFYRLAPNSTLATGPVKGTKRDKARMTVLLTANATGTVKEHPLVIGKKNLPMPF
ncbi:hypothetical protein BOTBODRAFT_78570, partial [Botryobasidium botryosum FD-172 SS1]